MESASILQSIAEVAVGLAGFGGIAAGLGYRTRGEWSAQDRVRLLGVVVNSLFVILGCFLPFAVHHLGIQPPWFLSGAVLCVAPVWGFWLQWRRVVAHSQAGHVSVQSGYNPPLAAVIALINLVALTLFLAVAFGVAKPGIEFGLYLTAVLLVLVNAAVSFLRLLATAFGEDAPSA